MSTNKDEVIKELYYKIQSKKNEIETSSAKPYWVTNCAFKYDSKSNEVINIQTSSDKGTLIHIAGWLIHQEELYYKGLKALDLKEEEYKWLGFTTEQWITDINTRISKITLGDKKKELKVLEDKLDKILPPAFRIELELETIMNSDTLK